MRSVISVGVGYVNGRATSGFAARSESASRVTTSGWARPGARARGAWRRRRGDRPVARRRRPGDA